MKPQRVVIKDFSGKALDRWMIAVLPTVAVITDEAGAKAVAGGLDPMYSLGFPLADVFCWPENVSCLQSDKPNFDEFTPKFG